MKARIISDPSDMIDPSEFVPNLIDDLYERTESVFENALSVEYIGSSSRVGDYEFPTGTITCDILNIPKSFLEGLKKYEAMFYPMAVTLYYGSRLDYITGKGYEKARTDALEVVRKTENIKPFCYFTEKQYVKDYSRLLKQFPNKNSKDVAALNEIKKTLASAVSVLVVGSSLLGFREMVEEILSDADSDSFERTVSGYAQAFEKYFKDSIIEDSLWLRYSSTIQKTYAVNGVFGKSIVFSSFLDLIASDFVEGLKLGHAPKKCRLCGRYFLTTDAHHPHYCNEINPSDPKGRTCRKLAKQKGSTEKAEDNPRIVIRTKAMANLRQAKSRGTVSEDEALIIHRLITEKCEMAAEKTDYCNGKYPDEMKMKNLRKEASQIRS